MLKTPSYVIVGSGVAGAVAAETLRKEGFNGDVHLIGCEKDLPYDRPSLSKEFLRGEKAEQDLYIKTPEFYDQQRILLHLGQKAKSLDLNKSIIDFEGGDALCYDKLLLATGSKVHKIDIPGNNLAGVFYLRTLTDSRRLAKALEKARKVVIVGAGFIGSEVAASCRVKGKDVTILETEMAPLIQILGMEVGKIYSDIHKNQGVNIRLGDSIVEIYGDDKAEQVVTSNGLIIECDLVVIGVGVEPEVSLAAGTEIALGDGILVDEYCRTSAPNVFAAGDVANWHHPSLGQRIRVEHWDNAQNQGAVAARNMLDTNEAYDPILYFWSDQYDLNIQYIGYANEWDNVIYRGQINTQSFSVFYLKDKTIRGALIVNKFKDIRPTRNLIKEKIKVEGSDLSDESKSLKQLIT